MDKAELRERMDKLFQRQQICLNVQKLLIVFTTVFYKCAIVLLPAHIAIVIVCGGILSNQASALASEKYPHVLLRTSYIGRGAGKDPYIIDEAKRRNDNLTVKILKFNNWTIYCFLAAMFAHIFMWCLSAALVF